MPVMPKIQFYEAFNLVNRKLTTAEIARKIGLNRNTVREWPKLLNQPQKKQRDMFMSWYRSAICLKDTRRGILELLDRYASLLPSTAYGIEWFDDHPEVYTNINLAWFFSNDYFFWTNRKGQAGDCQQWTHEGQDFQDFNRLVEEDRINEIVGLSLL